MPELVRPAIKTKPCGTCGEPIRVYPCRTRSRYCSYACANAGRRGKPNGRKLPPRERMCKVCGSVFAEDSRATTCSQECRRKAQLGSRRPRGSNRPSVQCLVCGRPFRLDKRRTQRYCSRACFGVSLRRNEGEGPVGRDGYRGANWRRVAAAVRERDGFACRNCGEAWTEGSKAFPVDHIRPWREFGTVDEANDPVNLVTLCPSCHSRKTHTFERMALSGDRVSLNWWREALLRGNGANEQRAFLIGRKNQRRMQERERVERA